ncbi:hypothetical protein [Actinomadura chibensis]|uniref:DUF4386 family protein n=1 Tax=Actinomadura chibensis TaxID=392828 RepID=A0A5D0NMM7_9ACTN|nr:hypothetical protein [Actinomadura chibensis]TYB45528.1 hypothetical protein FXF69_19040 [Actinomadura chibensis]
MTAATAPPATPTKVRDARTFWRVLLAVVAPVPALAIAVGGFVAPYDYGAEDGRDQFAATVAHHDRVGLMLLFSPILIFTLVPSALAMIAACRRHAPVFATVVGVLMTLGFLAGTANPSTDLLDYIAVDKNLDANTVITLGDSIENSGFGLILLPMLLTITIGRVLLAVLLWRVRVAPRWMAVAVGAAAPVEFVNVLGGNLQPGVAWVLTAVGFASASVALLRTPNDEFDLPPVRRPRPEAG